MKVEGELPLLDGVVLLPPEEGLAGLMGEVWASVEEELLLLVAALVVDLPASVASYFVDKLYDYSIFNKIIIIFIVIITVLCLFLLAVR